MIITSEPDPISPFTGKTSADREFLAVFRRKPYHLGTPFAEKPLKSPEPGVLAERGDWVRLLGIDEVGRGCWAGPLVAAAVVLHKSLEGLNDSKLLTSSQREILAKQIYKQSEVGLGWVSASQVDKLGLTQATKIAMRRAVNQITAAYTQIIIDGSYNFLCARTDLSQTGSIQGVVSYLKADVKGPSLHTYRGREVSCLVGADRLVPAVSAASIVAKVARDQYMSEMAANYPKYGFERHVGYGTKLHREMLKLYGASDLHRFSYKPLQRLTATNV